MGQKVDQLNPSLSSDQTEQFSLQEFLSKHPEIGGVFVETKSTAPWITCPYAVVTDLSYPDSIRASALLNHQLKYWQSYRDFVFSQSPSQSELLEELERPRLRSYKWAVIGVSDQLNTPNSSWQELEISGSGDFFKNLSATQTIYSFEHNLQVAARSVGVDRESCLAIATFREQLFQLIGQCEKDAFSELVTNDDRLTYYPRLFPQLIEVRSITQLTAILTRLENTEELSSEIVLWILKEVESRSKELLKQRSSQEDSALNQLVNALDTATTAANRFNELQTTESSTPS